MILRTHREWLDNVKDIPESDLPCNVSTVAYAITVAKAAVEAHDALLTVIEELTTEGASDAA